MALVSITVDGMLPVGVTIHQIGPSGEWCDGLHIWVPCSYEKSCGCTGVGIGYDRRTAALNSEQKSMPCRGLYVLDVFLVLRRVVHFSFRWSSSTVEEI